MTPDSRVRGRTMIIVSTQDWDDLHTRKQRFASRFADQGCRVLYVEAQWHWLTYLKQHGRARKRLGHWRRPPRLLKPNLWLWTPPPALPFFQMWESLARFNNRRLAPQLKRALTAIAGEEHPLLYLYTPYNSLLIDTLQPSATLYECVDDYAAAKGLIRKQTVEHLEAETLSRSDACVVTARGLLDQRSAKSGNIHLIPNAADVHHFARSNSKDTVEAPELSSIPGPRLGFLGALNYWIDLELLVEMAVKRPSWQIVIVGPVGVNVAVLRACPNIHLLGRQAYDRLPEFVAGFDVCINPYILDDVAAGCSPLKLYEYLASGKPIVSVAMPEAVQFCPPVRIGQNNSEFILACEAAIKETECDRNDRIAEQQQIAASHSWDNRFDRTLNVWEALLP